MDKPKLLFLLLLLSLALFACGTPVVKPEAAPPAVVQLARPQLPPAPPEVLVVREPNFQQRLLDFFQQTPATSSSGLQVKPTTPLGNSAPAK